MIFNTARLPNFTINGIRCFYQESTVSGGRKTVTHEYPYSNNRYVEDLGKLEKTFNIEAIIDTNTSFSNRDRLIDVLEKGGLLDVVHPAFGQKKLVLKNYSLVDNSKELGICRFSLVFEEAGLNIMPETLNGDKSLLSSLKSKILGDSEGKFNDLWKSVTTAKDKFDSANETLKNTASELKRIANLARGSVDTFSDFATSINEIIDGTSALIKTPSVLSSKIRSTFNNLSVAYDRSEDLFHCLTNFFGFNGSDQKSSQSDIINNQNQILNIFQANAIALAYEAAVNIDYSSQEDLSKNVSILEDGFLLLPDLDKDILKTIQQSRIESMNVFSSLNISLPKVISYETQKTSLNILIYSLYGDLNNKNLIKDLNGFKDTSNIEGVIKILSNV